jgi:tripartite-type tricarboxylate transporter receptor subunit TctC
MKPSISTALALVSLMATAAFSVCAQNYPNKVVRVLTTGAGGGGDIVGRILAQELAGAFGRQVIVENLPNITVNENVKKAAPDGYSLLLQSSSLWLLPLMSKHTSWDALRDFVPVSLLISQPNLLVVHPSLPIKSVKELIALAKGRPGEMNYATGNIGSPTHLATELFNSMAGVNIVSILYKSTQAALTDLVGGHVQMMFSNAASAVPLVKATKLKALAHTYTRPTTLAPGLPAISDTLPGYEAVTILGIFAPAGTPPAIVNRLSQEMARALNKAEIKEKLFDIGMDSIGGTPEQLNAAVKAEIVKWGKVIKDANIRLE